MKDRITFNIKQFHRNGSLPGVDASAKSRNKETSKSSVTEAAENLTLRGGATVLMGGSDEPNSFCVDSMFILKIQKLFIYSIACEPMYKQKRLVQRYVARH